MLKNKKNHDLVQLMIGWECIWVGTQYRVFAVAKISVSRIFRPHFCTVGWSGHQSFFTQIQSTMVMLSLCSLPVNTLMISADAPLKQRFVYLCVALHCAYRLHNKLKDSHFHSLCFFATNWIHSCTAIHTLAHNAAHWKGEQSGHFCSLSIAEKWRGHCGFVVPLPCFLLLIYSKL